jgi:acetyl esterase/lipase
MSTLESTAVSNGRFFPGPLSDGTAAFPYAPPRTGPLGELRYDNLVYSCEPGYRPLFLDLRVPQQGAGPHPVIIWVHGGGWNRGSRKRLPPHLFDNNPHDQMLDAGYAVAAIDYRLSREAAFPGMLSDIKAVTRWMRGHAAEFDLDPDRVVIWGESAGGHITLMSGLCTKTEGVERTGECLDQPELPNAIVDWYGPADLEALMRADVGGDSEESGAQERGASDVVPVIQQGTGWSYADLSPMSYIRQDIPPVFVAHGVEDSSVPVQQSRDLVAQLRAAGATVDYLEVPGAEHVWRGAPSVADIVAQSLNFVTKALEDTQR